MQCLISEIWYDTAFGDFNKQQRLHYNVLPLILLHWMKCYILTRMIRYNSGSGCSSGVGFGGDGEHVISLLEPGCGSVRTMEIEPF